MNSTRTPVVALLLTLAMLAGCASTKVTDASRPNAAAGAPSMIYIGNFDLGQATLKSDPGTITGRPRLINFGTTDPQQKLKQLSDLLADTVVNDLRQANLPAERLADDAVLPTSGWLVSGRFLKVAEGNRLQSAIIGFGMGKADAQLYVNVRDMARAPEQQDLLSMNVDANGNKMPGGGAAAVVTHTPYGMAAKFVLDRKASEKEIKRAGHQIADELKSLAANR